MNENLAVLRAAASEEARELETADILEPGRGAERLDRALEVFFATEPPTETWLAIVEDLALQGPITDSSPSQAAKTAATPRSAPPVSVEEALRSPRRIAREHVQAALGLGADAAEEFLERPAAALAQRKAEEVRDLATRVGRPLGELFADIASSWRASIGYVYAYRPGEAPETPALSAASTDIAVLVDWGEALFS
jgi:hypothetical protein